MQSIASRVIHGKYPVAMQKLMSPKINFSRHGFTLIELLVVLTIIAIAAAFSLPAMSTVVKGSQLTQGAQMINDQLTFARQTALSKTHSVEVRFYQYADPQTPGETAGSPATGKYRAMQIFDIQTSGTVSPVDSVQMVPQSIIIDSGTSLSSLLGISQQKAWTVSDPQVKLPRAGTSYNCRVFRFQPDGSTNLTSPPSQWFLTLHSINNGDAMTTPPSNYYTVQVNAINGHLQTYRP